MCSTVYTGNVSACCFSSRPTLPRTVKIVGSPAKGLASGVAPGGGGGSRMGAAHRVEFEYESWGLDYVFRAYDSDRVEIRFLGIRLVKRLET